MTIKYDPQRHEIPAIQEAAATLLNHIQPNENNSVEMELNKIKQPVETVKKALPKPDKIKKKIWMATEILNLMHYKTGNKIAKEGKI